MSIGEQIAQSDVSVDEIRNTLYKYRKTTIQVVELTLFGGALFLVGLNVGIRYAWQHAYVAEYAIPAMFGSSIPRDAKVWTDPLLSTADTAFWGAVVSLLVLGAVGWLAERLG